MRMNAAAQKWSPVGAVLLSATALLSAAPASADGTDNAFVAALAKHGIEFTNRNAAIATGHNLCADLENGQSPTTLVLSIVKDTNFSPHEAGYILGASVASYCPELREDIENSTS